MGEGKRFKRPGKWTELSRKDSLRLIYYILSWRILGVDRVENCIHRGPKN